MGREAEAIALLREVADPDEQDVPASFGSVLLERGSPLHDRILAFLAAAPQQPPAVTAPETERPTAYTKRHLSDALTWVENNTPNGVIVVARALSETADAAPAPAVPAPGETCKAIRDGEPCGETLALMCPMKGGHDERCESGCDAPVTHHDSEGIPLCDGCYDDLAREAAPAPAVLPVETPPTVPCPACDAAGRLDERDRLYKSFADFRAASSCVCRGAGRVPATPPPAQPDAPTEALPCEDCEQDFSFECNLCRQRFCDKHADEHKTSECSALASAETAAKSGAPTEALSIERRKHEFVFSDRGGCGWRPKNSKRFSDEGMCGLKKSDPIHAPAAVQPIMGGRACARPGCGHPPGVHNPFCVIGNESLIAPTCDCRGFVEHAAEQTARKSPEELAREWTKKWMSAFSEETQVTATASLRALITTDRRGDR
jgi:hypothetical protein